MSDDAKESIQAFKEKRPPVLEGRQPPAGT